jgi:hypothetical protein
VRWLAAALACTSCVATEFVKQPEPKPCQEAVASPVRGGSDVTAALEAFVRAVEAKDFESAYRLLSHDARRRYSPARLAQDFATEPSGAQLLARAKAALRVMPTVTKDRATLAVATGKVAALERESDGWHVASLDEDSNPD